MFVTYPVDATKENWVHESICYAFTTICNAINVGEDIPVWPNTIPADHRPKLRSKTKIKRLLNAFAVEARKISGLERTRFLALHTQFNQIPGLLDGSIPLPIIPNGLKPLVIIAKSICEEGFELLKKTGVRDVHYKAVWDSFVNKKCPFCGYEPFEAPKMRKEDEDHFLPRTIYPLSAANLHNLVPMGGKCNRSYKGRQDLIRKNGVRRRVINPYGPLAAELSLINSDPLGESDNTPTWRVDLVPDVEEIKSCDDIFSVRLRLTENFLKPYYETWLSSLTDWFKIRQLDRTIDNERLFREVDGFAQYSRGDKDSGPIYLKSKVAEMLAYHCRAGNPHVIAMLRSGLPLQPIAA